MLFPQLVLFRRYKNQLENCFLSSTQWTESIGLQAAYCTLNEFKNWESFYQRLSVNSELLRSSILDAFQSSQLEIYINSVPTMISFRIQSCQGFSSEDLRTLLLDLMLGHKIMMSTTIYPSILHTKNYQRKFYNALATL